MSDENTKWRARAARLSLMEADEKMGGAPVRDLALLLFVFEKEGMQTLEYGEKLGMDASTASQAIARLAASSASEARRKGGGSAMIEKRRSATDGRAWTLHMTAAGKKLVTGLLDGIAPPK